MGDLFQPVGAEAVEAEEAMLASHTRPRWEHTCENCQFVGRYGRFDVYRHLNRQADRPTYHVMEHTERDGACIGIGMNPAALRRLHERLSGAQPDDQWPDPDILARLWGMQEWERRNEHA
jgi:hypothetical protein